MLYSRVTETVNDRGQLMPRADVYKILGKKINTKDFYMSPFFYTEDHYKIFKEKGTIAGITDVVTDTLFFDFDDKVNPVNAQKDAVNLVSRLLIDKFRESDIQIFFSGKKGFAVVVQTESQMNPREVKNICTNYATGLSTLDTGIYNASRIFRLPLTKHQDTGLYKIPIGVSDLSSLTFEQIKKDAAVNFSPADIEGAWTVAKLTSKMLELKEKAPEIKLKENSIRNMDLAELNRDAMPKGWDLARWALFNGFFETGSRNYGLLCLASYLSKSFPVEITYRMLKGTCELQSKRTGEDRFSDTELYNNIIMQVYGPNWKGGTYSLTDPNSWLYQYASEMGLLTEATLSVSKDILTIEDVSQLFESFALNIDKNRIFFGIKEIDDALSALVGRVYVLAGAPGSGKTSLLFQIFENLGAQNNRAIFFSFDMSLQDCFQKIIQKEFKIPERQVYEEMKNPAKRKEFYDLIYKKYGNIHFIKSSGMSIDAMKERIKQVEKTYGEVRLVAVDYMTLTQSEKSDSNEHSKAVMQGLKSIAVDMHKCVLSINQPNKANQKINEPIGGYGGIQGSSAVQELANAILWVYRPGASPDSFENDKYYSIECMKNRHGAMFSCDLAWNGLTGTVRSMGPGDRIALQKFREELKEKKKAEKDSSLNF